MMKDSMVMTATTRPSKVEVSLSTSTTSTSLVLVKASAQPLLVLLREFKAIPLVLGLERHLTMRGDYALLTHTSQLRRK